MEVIKEILDSTGGTMLKGTTAIGLSLVEGIPYVLRILILAAVFVNICVKTYTEFKK